MISPLAGKPASSDMLVKLEETQGMVQKVLQQAQLRIFGIPRRRAGEASTRTR